jgi:hypothetical protein
MADGMQKDWRELCVAVTNESEDTKLSLLVQQLIEALVSENEGGVTPFAHLTQVRRIRKPLEHNPIIRLTLRESLSAVCANPATYRGRSPWRPRQPASFGR